MSDGLGYGSDKELSDDAQDTTELLEMHCKCVIYFVIYYILYEGQ